jgi:ABC-type Na+ efflux pump permease subunit
MLRDARFIALKELKFILRARETIVWVFVMPIVFFYFVGTITSGFGPRARGKDRIAVRSDSTSGFLAEALMARLADGGYAVASADTVSDLDAYARTLTIPPFFTDSVVAGVPTALRFENDSNGLAGDSDAIRVQRAAYTTLADLAVISATKQEPTREALTTLHAMPRALTLDVRRAGERQRIPTGFEQAIPGIMVMFTLMVMATSGAILLLTERRQGLLRRLAYTPIRRRDVVLGKWMGKWLVGLVQIGFAMAAGTILFKMNWGPDLGWVIAVMVVYGGLMAAMGMILGSVARTEGQAVAIGVISANLLAALGGCWWPIEVAPKWAQSIQLFLPTGWAMDALHKLISFGAGAGSVAPHLVGMLFGTVVLVAVAGKVFRYQ